MRSQLIMAAMMAASAMPDEALKPAPPPVRKPEPRNDAERIERAKGKRARKAEKRARMARLKAAQESGNV